MHRIKVFIVNTIILVITTFLIRSISIFFDIYIANKIGSEGIGLFNLIKSVYFFALTIANSGISLASTRVVAEELSLNNKTGAKIAIKKCLAYSIFFGIFAAVLLILLAPMICTTLLHNKVSTSVLYIISISLPFSSMSSAICGYFIGVKKVIKNSIYDIFSVLSKIVIIFLLFKYLNTSNLDFACFILIIANSISEILSFILLYILYKFDIKFIGEFRNNGSEYLKRILSISLPVAITSYIRSGLSTIKQLLIPLRLEKHGMTCDQSIQSYGLIIGITMPLLLFPGIIINSISSLLIPEFARYEIKQDFKKMCEVINMIFSSCIIYSVIVCLIYIIFHKNIAFLAYKNTDISSYILLLSPLMIFMYLDHIVDAILKGIDKQVSVMYCNIIDLFTSIFLIYTLIPVYGLYGYIFILYFSEIFNFSISIYQLHSTTGFNLNIKLGLLSLFNIFKRK